MRRGIRRTHTSTAPPAQTTFPQVIAVSWSTIRVALVCVCEQIWADLKHQGFNDQLELVNARAYVLSIHSDSRPGARFSPVPFDAELYEAAMELPITKNGKATEYGDGMIVVHSLVRTDREVERPRGVAWRSCGLLWCGILWCGCI